MKFEFHGCPKIKGKKRKPKNFCPGAEPGAPDVGKKALPGIAEPQNLSYIDRYAYETKGGKRNPQNICSGGSQGPLTTGELWSKALVL